MDWCLRYSPAATPSPRPMHLLRNIRSIPSQVFLILPLVDRAGDQSSSRLVPYGNCNRPRVGWAGVKWRVFCSIFFAMSKAHLCWTWLRRKNGEVEEQQFEYRVKRGLKQLVFCLDSSGNCAITSTLSKIQSVRIWRAFIAAVPLRSRS